MRASNLSSGLWPTWPITTIRIATRMASVGHKLGSLTKLVVAGSIPKFWLGSILQPESLSLK